MTDLQRKHVIWKICFAMQNNMSLDQRINLFKRFNLDNYINQLQYNNRYKFEKILDGVEADVLLGLYENSVVNIENLVDSSRYNEFEDGESIRQAKSVDIVIVTIIPEEFEAVCRLFETTKIVYFPDNGPNLYSWRRGSLTHEDSGMNFSVVVGMSGRSTNASSSIVVIDAINRFHPQYVLLVGIAGGFQKDNIMKGDVVISNFIVGYQYGKLDDKFNPRPNFSYPVDTALLNAAQSIQLFDPVWGEGVDMSPIDNFLPKCVPGLVASGDMVVDDAGNDFFQAILHHYPNIAAVEMEGAGAAQAIQYAQDKKLPVGFLMIRGISDMPKCKEDDPQKIAEISGQSPHMLRDVKSSNERDLWKRYASNVAARFAFQMISKTWPVKPTGC